jgi:hypothetical protein
MNEVSQKQTYSTWHDAYKTKEFSIQTIQIKFIYAFGANTTNITKVDWDEIKLTLTNWLLKTMTHYGCKFFKKKYFVLNVIKPNLHGMEKYDMFRISCESKNK